MNSLHATLNLYVWMRERSIVKARRMAQINIPIDYFASAVHQKQCQRGHLCNKRHLENLEPQKGRLPLHESLYSLEWRW